MSDDKRYGLRIESRQQIHALDFGKGDGLVPVIAQHALDGTVLMLGYADAEALEVSLECGQLTFFSRSRRALWRKGETSGNTLELVALLADCDADAVLARVLPAGPSCHTGHRACFDTAPPLASLFETLRERAVEPPTGSYTARLLEDRNLRLKKLGEETAELLVALGDLDHQRRAEPPRGPSAARSPLEAPEFSDAPSEAARLRAIEEAADLMYHLLVACQGAGIDADEILGELERRAASN